MTSLKEDVNDKTSKEIKIKCIFVELLKMDISQLEKQNWREERKILILVGLGELLLAKKPTEAHTIKIISFE